MDMGATNVTLIEYQYEIRDLARENVTKQDIEQHDWPNDYALDVLRHATFALAAVPARMDGEEALWYLAVESMWADVQREKAPAVA